MKNWLMKLKEFPLAGPQIPSETLHWIKEKRWVAEKRSVATNSYTVLKTIAMGTDYIIAGPAFLFAREVNDGHLVELPIEDTPPWKVSVLMTRPACHSRIVNNFVACVRTEMAAICGD